MAAQAWSTRLNRVKIPCSALNTAIEPKGEAWGRPSGRIEKRQPSAFHDNSGSLSRSVKAH